MSAEAVPTTRAMRPLTDWVAGSRSAFTRKMPYRPRLSVAPASTGAKARGAAAYARCSQEFTGTSPAFTPKPKKVRRNTPQRAFGPREFAADLSAVNSTEGALTANSRKPSAAASVPASPIASSKYPDPTCPSFCPIRLLAMSK